MGAKYLTAPGPGKEAVLKAVACSLTAPDHGGLHPARIVEIADREKFADFFESGALDEGASEEDAKKARSKAIKAPSLFALVVRIHHDNVRVPPYEQWMTSGAFVSSFLTALEAQGFAGKIVSGSSTRYPDAVKALCREDEVIACWVMVGTPRNDIPVRGTRENAERFFSVY